MYTLKCFAYAFEEITGYFNVLKILLLAIATMRLHGMHLKFYTLILAPLSC